MANEELVVIGFGVALAVITVALFWAHVKRINAPNKADPRGIMVEIVGLGSARARDSSRASATRGSSNSTRNHVSTLGADSGVSMVCRRSSEGVGGVVGGVCGVTKGAKISAAEGCEEDKASSQHVAETIMMCDRKSTMLLPSSLWAEAIVKHATVKRKALRGMVKTARDGRSSGGWESTWANLTLAQRGKVLTDVRDEVCHAVSSYIKDDEALFATLCPEIDVDEFEREPRGLPRLVRQCVDGQLSEPKSRAYAAVRAALAKAAASEMENVSKSAGIGAKSAQIGPKNELGPVGAFLPTFRKLCVYSFCIGVLEATLNGRADGSAGPTISSVAGALARTGFSGLLVWAFFHGLRETTAGTNTAIEDARSLPLLTTNGSTVLLHERDEATFEQALRVIRDNAVCSNASDARLLASNEVCQAAWSCGLSEELNWTLCVDHVKEHELRFHFKLVSLYEEGS